MSMKMKRKFIIRSYFKQNKKKINLSRCYIHGSMTIEAAFVMPIVIITVFSLIYLSFCLHDRCKIQGTVDKILHRSELSVKHDGDLVTGYINYDAINDRGVFYIINGNTQEEASKIKGYLIHELSKGLFLYKVTSSEVEVGKFNIVIEVKAENKLTLPYFNFALNKFKELKVFGSGSIHNPAETIRCAEVILDTGSSIKGVDALKEKLEELLQDQN